MTMTRAPTRSSPKIAKKNIHPGRLTWNLQITHLERKMIFQTSMIMFHVNLPGGSIFEIPDFDRHNIFTKLLQVRTQTLPLSKALVPNKRCKSTKWSISEKRSFLLPLIGGRWYIIPQLAIYKRYTYCQLGDSMLPTTY